MEDPATGEAVVLGSLTSEQVLSPPHLQKLLWEVTGVTIRVFKRNSDEWRAFVGAIKRAATVVPHDVTEAGVWRERLAVFVRGRAANPLDPEDGEDRRKIFADEGVIACFVDPRGRLWVERAALARFVNVVLGIRVSEEDAGTGLAALGFEAGDAGKIQLKAHGRVRVRRFWRSTPDFDVEGE